MRHISQKVKIPLAEVDNKVAAFLQIILRFLPIGGWLALNLQCMGVAHIQWPVPQHVPLSYPFNLTIGCLETFFLSLAAHSHFSLLGA